MTSIKAFTSRLSLIHNKHHFNFRTKCTSVVIICTILGSLLYIWCWSILSQTHNKLLVGDISWKHLTNTTRKRNQLTSPLAWCCLSNWWFPWWSPLCGRSQRNLWWGHFEGPAGTGQYGGPEWTHTDSWDTLWTVENRETTIGVWGSSSMLL